MQMDTEQKLSNECIRQNLLISKREYQRILFLTERKNISVEVQDTLFNIANQNGYGVNMIMDLVTITSLDNESAHNFAAFNYIIVFIESPNFIDA